MKPSTFFHLLGFTLGAILLFACTTPSLRTQSELAQSKRYFEQGYYKRAMRDLLPLACDGDKEAQYAVGYFYYYGYGVAQDTDVGYFWIKRAADQGYQPAIAALALIAKQASHPNAQYPDQV